MEINLGCFRCGVNLVCQVSEYLDEMGPVCVSFDRVSVSRRDSRLVFTIR